MGRTKGSQQDHALRRARLMRLSPDAVELRMDGLPTNLVNAGILKKVLLERVIEGKPADDIFITSWDRSDSKKKHKGMEVAVSEGDVKAEEKEDKLIAQTNSTAKCQTAEQQVVEQASPLTNTSEVNITEADATSLEKLPVVRDIHRRAYVDSSGTRRNCAYLVFRNKDEATSFKRKWDGEKFANGVVATFAEAPLNRIVHASEKKASPVIGEDPTLKQQMVHLTRKEMERRLSRDQTTTEDGKSLSIPALQKVLVSVYENKPRTCVHVKAYPLPLQMKNRILKTCRELLWPAKPIAKEYLELMSLLRDILIWAEPTYVCTHATVIRNFRGSPHVDRADKSYQFALAVGDYEGGELVVESEDHTKQYVVDTHDGIVKVDGRRLHWVRGFSGNERYSIIFFCLDPNQHVPLTTSIYPDFVPAGEESQVNKTSIQSKT